MLDWGCGHGQISRLLRDRDVEVVSFDYLQDSEPGVMALEHFPEIDKHVSGDPVALPFGDGEFDTVLSCGVLEHVQRPADSLDELHRVLRPGGSLLIYKLPNRLSYLEAIARRAGMYYHGALPDDRVYDRRSATALRGGTRLPRERLQAHEHAAADLEHPLAWRLSGPIWNLNRALARVPGVALLATNLELDATAR